MELLTAQAPKVLLKTLGCRLNQYETQAMKESLLQAGYSEVQDIKEADLFVLNTCTVTEEADKESRYWIRKFHRENPEAKIVVTGCYAERDRETIEALPGVSLTVLNREKPEILSLIESRLDLLSKSSDCPDYLSFKNTTSQGCTSFSLPRIQPISKRAFPSLSISEFEGRRRAYLKIQDGCNHACSFCKVVLVRGPSRSRDLNDVLEEAKRLVTSGHEEVVLTGIQLGAYGYDVQKRQMLAELLEHLSEIEGLRHIRLSSIEPTDVTDELISAMARLEKVCPHLHIPLQSGDDSVLKRMNRRYSRDFYRALIQKIRAQVRDFVFTTDVMVGFPGETTAQFDQTVQLLIDLEAYKLHIFPFSPREGTKAMQFLGEAVSAEEFRRRRNALLLLEEKLRRKIQERFLGRVLEVVPEEKYPLPGWVLGHTRNFLKVRFPTPENGYNSIFRALIEKIDGDELMARVVGHPEEVCA